MSISKKVFNRLESWLAKPKFNLFKTVYFNFRTLPIREAMKMPVYLYGKVQIDSLAGIVSINGASKRGLIKIGRNTDRFFSTGKTFFYITEGSRLIFSGPATFGSNCSFRLTNNGSILFGIYFRSGSHVRFYSEDIMEFGDYTGITYNCQVLNTNFHYTIDKTNNAIHRNTKPIIIGACNWIGNSSTIMKGTKTPSNTIVTSNSLLNKDYGDLYGKDTPLLLAGIPAKLVRTDLQRIFSYEIEGRIRKQFMASDCDAITWPGVFSDNVQDVTLIF